MLVTADLARARAAAGQMPAYERDIRALELALTQIAPDPSLRVGSTVSASTTKVGSILDLSRVEHESLSKYTQDAGNHVTIELRRSATLSIP